MRKSAWAIVLDSEDNVLLLKERKAAIMLAYITFPVARWIKEKNLLIVLKES